MKVVDRTVAAVDRFQQRHKGIGFPYSVVKKFGDDRAGYLAALIAYYGFFSLFPLLLVFVSVLGIVLHGNPDLQHKVVTSALSNFPIVGKDIATRSLPGSGAALVIGIVGTLWAGLGVTQAAQYAMNEVWEIPQQERPNFLWGRLRGLGLLGILGTTTILSTVLSGIGGSTAAWYLRVAGVVLSLLLNLGLFLVSYRVLTKKNLSWRDVLPGSIAAAILWTALQAFGGYYVTHQLAGARNTYGTFAIVIGLLVWIYLGAQLTIYCAEINVVARDRLWPRSLQPAKTPTEADRRVLAAMAKAEKRIPPEYVDVDFDGKRSEEDDAGGRPQEKDRPDSRAESA